MTDVATTITAITSTPSLMSVGPGCLTDVGRLFLSVSCHVMRLETRVLLVPCCVWNNFCQIALIVPGSGARHDVYRLARGSGVATGFGRSS